MPDCFIVIDAYENGIAADGNVRQLCIADAAHRWVPPCATPKVWKTRKGAQRAAERYARSFYMNFRAVPYASSEAAAV
tara:strand:+ start:3335 stop:3568 length:234 start_codon:yes stop_codon:yes gene_type:complete